MQKDYDASDNPEFISGGDTDSMNDRKLRRLRDRSNGNPTLVSEGCKITGTLSGDGNYMISGNIDGDCDLEGTVTLTTEGYWKGVIRAESVIIAGTVDGDIEARGRVEISETARISGTVTGEAIAVAEGAVIEGVMRTTSSKDPVEFVEKRKTVDQT